MFPPAMFPTISAFLVGPLVLAGFLLFLGFLVLVVVGWRIKSDAPSGHFGTPDKVGLLALAGELALIMFITRQFQLWSLADPGMTLLLMMMWLTIYITVGGTAVYFWNSLWPESVSGCLLLATISIALSTALFEYKMRIGPNVRESFYKLAVFCSVFTLISVAGLPRALWQQYKKQKRSRNTKRRITRFG